MGAPRLVEDEEVCAFDTRSINVSKTCVSLRKQRLATPSQFKPYCFTSTGTSTIMFVEDWVSLGPPYGRQRALEEVQNETNAPADAGSARDMLAAGAGAGASSGAAADPRAAVEAAVSAAPDDPSEGDKLNLPTWP